METNSSEVKFDGIIAEMEGFLAIGHILDNDMLRDSRESRLRPWRD